MSEQEKKIALSKIGQREVTPFIGHELLYDYIADHLDAERKAAVEDHLKFSVDAQLDLAKIQRGYDYAKKLGETEVSEPVVSRISTPSNYLTVLMQKSNFDKWPQGIKWGLEALVVVTVIVTLLTVTPWQKVLDLEVFKSSKDVVLAEVTKGTSTSSVESAAPGGEDKPQFADEDAEELGTTAVSDAKGPSIPKVELKEDVKVAKAPSPTPSPSPTPVSKAEEKPEPAAATAGGFLYRGEIAITNISVNGAKITEKIVSLGGRKAGSVELGWQKTPTSMYYHFTIPEAKYQELNTFLATYGTPQIAKEKHVRVMPDGIIRLILIVDEAAK